MQYNLSKYLIYAVVSLFSTEVCYKGTLVIRGVCVSASRRVYRKRLQRKTRNIPVIFLSYTP